MNDNFIKKLRNNRELKHIAISNDNALQQDNTLNIEQLPFFKVPAEMYQKFDVVWHTQNGFGRHINWRTILDEMIRLIGREGRIVMAIDVLGEIRVCYDYQAILANVKTYLFRRIGLECYVEYETPLIHNFHAKSNSLKCGGRIFVVFAIKRLNIDIYKEKLWSFAVITGGSKADNVVEFCKSVRNFDHNFEHEIIVCGPKNNRYDEYEVKYMDYSIYRDEYAEICKKKNDIAKIAQNQNLLITHDRFFLGMDFLIGFEKYGYDFDFLSPIILDKNGSESIYWMLIKKNIFDANNILHNDLFDGSDCVNINNPEIAKELNLSHSFLSGGCLIFKRDILQKIKFNELLFWHQIEDWEISKQFLVNGLVIKSNRFSSVINLRDIENVNDSKLKKSKTFARRFRRSLAKRIIKWAFNIYTK